MAEEDDTLVTRRSKRSTAGNRMAAALAEFRVEELGQDVEEDADFEMLIDEQDAFESDFESTDEEGAQEDVDAAAEKMVRDEERQKKKVVRSQLEKVTAAAHARQKATFNPQIRADVTKPSAPPKPKRRVSLGVVVDAETGLVIPSGKRHSQRSYTVLSTSTSDARFRDELEKKSTAPKKIKTKTPPPTQAQLIARALDMEEDNINEHRNYLTLEEEKRKKARLVRENVEGPLLRWISKAEKEKVLVEQPRPPPPPPSMQPLLHPMTPGTPDTPYTYAYYPQATPGSSSTPVGYVAVPAPYYPSVSNPHQTGSSHPGRFQSIVIPPPLILHPQLPPIEEERTAAKNYLVHEVDQGEGAPRPLWRETMSAMFGDHVNWEQVRVYTGRNRPITRPVQPCPITGQPARYIDPRTNVPFANIAAYKTLTRLLSHEYVWSESMGCYTGFEAPHGTSDSS